MFEEPVGDPMLRRRFRVLGMTTDVLVFVRQVSLYEWVNGVC